MTARSDLKSAYRKALSWVAVFISLNIVASSSAHLLFTDFFHEPVFRKKGEWITMMLVFPPLEILFSFLGTFLIFGISQFFQFRISTFFWDRFGSRSHYLVALMLPVTAIITFYSFDYLVPSGIKPVPEWSDYKRGITLFGYLTALSFQAIITLFNILYIASYHHHRYRRALVLGISAMIVLSSAYAGFRDPAEQAGSIERPDI